MKAKYYFNETEAKLKNAVKAGLTACGVTVLYKAQEYTPVDTGRLRDSLNYALKKNEVTIGTNVEYAPYVEFGTGRRALFGRGKSNIKGQRPRSFMRRAFDRTRGKLVSTFMYEFRRVLK